MTAAIDSTSPAPASAHAPAGTARVAPPSHVASLDGLRALAVLGVLAVHAGTPGAELGWLGVDLFFVLSGFLITTLLVREYDRTGSIHLLKFWARRFLRLMPAYWLYIGVMTVLMLKGFGWTRAHGGWTPGTYMLSLWAYFVNFAPMGGIWEYQPLTIALWSLAVEEQFYLLWPGICLLLMKLRGRIAPAGIAWAIVGTMMAYHFFWRGGGSDNLLQSRGIGIVIGCAFALTYARASGRARSDLRHPVLRISAIVGCLLLCGTLELLLLRHRIAKEDIHHLFIPALDLFFALIIAMLWYGSRDRLTEALAWRPLAYVGRISYGIYLYHMAAHELVWGVWLKGLSDWSKWPKFGLRVTVFFALSIAIASISYYVVERPFLKLKDRVR